MPNSLFGSRAGVVLASSYLPNNATFRVSDYCAMSVAADRMRFSRPTIDGQGFETANPGARVRFNTNSSIVQINLQYTNLVTRMDTYDGQGAILSNGIVVASFNRAQGVAGPYQVRVDFGTTVDRLIEVVFPYCASVDFIGVDALAGTTLTVPVDRPSTRFVATGDSITHGFAAVGVTASWPYKLGLSKGWQVVNHGYGGRSCIPADGTALASLSPSIATYLIGYNDFYAQLSLATFKANYKSFINNFRTVNTTTKLYCITPLWSSNSYGALTLEMYRTQIRNALTEIANPLNVLVEGAPLATGNVSSFPDAIHPNDFGSSEIATSLAAVMPTP